MTIKNKTKHKRQVLERIWPNENPCTLLVRMLNDAVAMAISMEVPREIKKKIERPYYLAIPLLSIILK